MSSQVSIGMPVYNGGRTLRTAIDSLLNQRFGSFELLISDNASTDETGAIAQDYAARDARVTYVRQKSNMGAPGNFDYVFSETSAPYFMWAACDDIRHPDWLAKAVTALDEQPNAVLAACDIAMVDDINEYSSPDCHISYHRLGNGISSESLAHRYRTIVRPGGWAATYGLMRRSALQKTRRLSQIPELNSRGIAADYVLMEMCIQGKFAYIPEYLLVNQVRWRSHEELAPYLAGDTRVEAGAQSAYLWLMLDIARMASRHRLPVRDRIALYLEFFRSSRSTGTLHSFLVDRNLEASLSAKKKRDRYYLWFERNILIAPNRFALAMEIRRLSTLLERDQRDLKDRTARLERHIAKYGPE